MRLWLCFFIACSPLLAAAQAEDAGLTQRVEDLERQVREIKGAKPETAPAPVAPLLPAATPAEWLLQDTSQTITGLGPVASKAYFNKANRTWLLGLSAQFFTFHAQNGGTAASPATNRTNIGAIAPLIAVRFGKRLLFNSQILLENGGAESSDTVTLQKGQSVVRMAYLDWLASDDGRAGLRVGHQLVPIGLLNTSADPTTYFGVNGPELERELIPSSWHENGIAFWVDRPRAEVQAAVFSSLDSSGFRKDTFLAGGRSQGQNSASEDLMGVLRINARREHVTLGLSTAFGNTAQKSPSLRTGGFQLGEAHLHIHFPRLQLLGMMAQGEVQDADAISVVNSTVMGSQARGYYGQAAGELLNRTQKLWAFFRYSHYNLHDRVPESLAADSSLNKTVATTGLSYFPLPTLVLKADYSTKRSAAGSRLNEFSLGAGLVF